MAKIFILGFYALFYYRGNFRIMLRKQTAFLSCILYCILSLYWQVQVLWWAWEQRVPGVGEPPAHRLPRLLLHSQVSRLRAPGKKVSIFNGCYLSKKNRHNLYSNFREDMIRCDTDYCRKARRNAGRVGM